MYALTKNERNRRQYVRSVRRLMAKTFGLTERDTTEQNKVWEEWLAIKQQEFRDLRGLLKTDVKHVFMARALAILLVPNLRLVPYAWSDTTSLDNYLGLLAKEIGIAKASPKLRDFVLALLEINTDMVSSPGASEELSQTLHYYNRYILEALALFEEDDPRAAKLFGRYQLNDPVMFYNTDDSSGYNPFRDLLHNPHVPEKWKRIADEKMREVILAEEEGRVQPRREWEGALANYVSHIKLNLGGEEFPYSADLFASQVDFILGLSSAGEKHFDAWHIAQMLQLLAGEDRKELRHRLVRHVVLSDPDRCGAFTVYSDETLTVARSMLEEFGEADAELGARLTDLIDKGAVHVLKAQAAHSKHSERVEAVMARMR